MSPHVPLKASKVKIGRLQQEELGYGVFEEVGVP
jgi:hypothetical protein